MVDSALRVRPEFWQRVFESCMKEAQGFRSPGPFFSGKPLSVELLFLGRAGQRSHRRCATLDHGGHVIEVTGTHFLLVRHEGVAFAGVSEFLLLQLHVGGHVVAGVVVRQVEHAVPHVVDARQGDELVLVAHGRQLALELGDGGVVQVWPGGFAPDHVGESWVKIIN